MIEALTVEGKIIMLTERQVEIIKKLNLLENGRLTIIKQDNIEVRIITEVSDKLDYIDKT